VSKPDVLIVLERWREECPHPRNLRTGKETLAAWLLWVLAGLFLWAGAPFGAALLLGFVLLVFGTPWPPILPTVRLIAAAKAEAAKDTRP
jgi:hypothetical protein